MNSNKVLQHIAFIMDGNRRWAKSRHLPVIAGHQKGAARIEPLVEYAAKRGIKYITFWAFSSENWSRGEKEVGFLMRVFRGFINSPVVNRMMQKGVRVRVIGDWESFPKDIVNGVSEIIERSKNNETITATFALNYGGRRELLNAVNAILKDAIVLNNKFLASRQKLKSQNSNLKTTTQNLKFQKWNNSNYIDEDNFSSYLSTSNLPNPDMIVRTGGEQRLSGFLPWQSVYSELYFTEVLWPDFGEKEFEKAIEEYESRERRFGK